jgi:hypothetical protein
MTFQWPWPKDDVKYARIDGDGCTTEKPTSRTGKVRQYMRWYSLEIVVALLFVNAITLITLSLASAVWWNSASRSALDSPMPNCELILRGSSR